MAVKAADPDAIELDNAFRAAMDAPARPHSADTPPEIDPDAPHGRDDDGNPNAPYGYTKDGRVKRAPGRPSKDSQARTGVALPEPGSTSGATRKPQTTQAPADYSAALSELSDAIWLGLSGLGMVGPQIPVVGKFLPADKITAEAAIFRFQKDALCGAVQVASEHNASAARFCQKIAGGGPTWIAMVGFAVMPFFAQTAAVLRGDDALVNLGMPKLDELAEKNRADLGEFMQHMAQAAASGDA